jgi:inner membrane protein
MASAISHAYVALSLSSSFPARQLPRRWLVLGMAWAVVPDIDVIGFQFGIRYGDLLGHRGITHSLAFAALLSILVAACVPRQKLQQTKRSILALFLFVVTASHGLLMR